MRDERRVRKIFPVNLMLEGRPCLVVGSGQIAARKVGHLLDSGATVTVVGPTASDEIRRWAVEGCVRYLARAFRPADLKGQQVVLAATDDGQVNGEVIRLCRMKHILCSAADGHWAESDFMVPATLRSPHITLTLSTGGASCRRARLAKDYLARHLEIIRSADLMVISVRQTRPASKRAVQDLGSVLHQVWGVHEFVIVNRPDRLDVLAVVAARMPQVAALVRELVTARFGGRCVIRRGPAAIQDISRRFMGPAHQAALMSALVAGTRAGWAGSMMKEWIESGVGPAESGKYQRRYESIIRSI